MTDTSTEHSEDLWAGLRRRKLVQWGLAYAAGAWGLQQGLAYVSTLLDWPVQVQRLTGLALLIGLPIALVLAWYHGDRGERQVTRSELAILAVLFLLGGGVFWYFQRTNDAATVASPPPSAPALATDASIAVLPFVNMSADKEQEYFADGISEELLNLLAHVPELRVIARTSSFSFKGKDVDIADIARKLDVANVLEGSVRKSGDTVRITTQLIRASDSSHLWSETYDRPLTEVFAVQDEIAARVVAELKIKLLGNVPKAKATDPEAYAMFLQAREISRQYTESAFERAIGLYKQALAIDASYAPAWLGLAITYCDQLDNYLRPTDEGIQLAREATKMALLHESRYALAHGRLGWIATYYDRDLAAGARHVEHALALEPDDPDIIAIAAGLARLLGHFDHAIALGEYLSVRDPVNMQGGYELGSAYFYAGRLDEAIAAYRAFLRVFPIAIGMHAVIGEVLLLKGEAAAALSEIEQESQEAARLEGLAMAYHTLGRPNESDAALRELIEKYDQTRQRSIALVLAFRGEADRAFEWLDKAIDAKDLTVGMAAVSPMFASLHSDPRWLPFLRRVGMAPEQLAAIKFDVKVPD